MDITFSTGSAAPAFPLRVRDNAAPVFESDPNTTTTPGSLYEYEVVVSDPDGDDVTLSATVLPAWLGLTENHVLIGRAPSDTEDTGYDVALVASDGMDSASQAFTIENVVGFIASLDFSDERNSQYVTLI